MKKECNIYIPDDCTTVEIDGVVYVVREDMQVMDFLDELQKIQEREMKFKID